MHVPILAGPRRRTRRALLAAVLPAAVAAFALPAAAQAGDIFVSNDGQLSYLDNSNKENNDVLLRVEGNEIVITDTARITSSSLACQVVNPNRAECPANLDVTVNTLGGTDQVEYRLPHEGFVQLGSNNDTLIAGTREAALRAIGRVTYSGGPGYDRITYHKADRGVSVTPEDTRDNDGRPGDHESVSPDFEIYEGSEFSDAPLFGTVNTDLLIGRGGNDVLGAGHGNDGFLSTSRDGADDYHGGPGTDFIELFGRTQPLLIDLDNVADDGELGENDNLRSNVENIYGGSGNDSIKSMGAHSTIDGRGGNDHIVGGFGPDTLIGGTGVDRLEGGTENDVIDSRDGEEPEVENVDCGPGIDALQRDADGFVGCEDVKVGVLRLAPKTVQAEAGRIARLRLSWRHPKAWKQLRTIELRLTRDGVSVGALTIRARDKRITGDGALQLVRKQTRLTRKGKSVIARLAVRLDGSVAGATLKAEVEATDTRGRRQLERDAGTVRVAP